MLQEGWTSHSGYASFSNKNYINQICLKFEIYHTIHITLIFIYYQNLKKIKILGLPNCFICLILGFIKNSEFEIFYEEHGLNLYKSLPIFFETT